MNGQTQLWRDLKAGDEVLEGDRFTSADGDWLYVDGKHLFGRFYDEDDLPAQRPVIPPAPLEWVSFEERHPVESDGDDGCEVLWLSDQGALSLNHWSDNGTMNYRWWISSQDMLNLPKRLPKTDPVRKAFEKWISEFRPDLPNSFTTAEQAAERASLFTGFKAAYNLPR